MKNIIITIILLFGLKGIAQYNIPVEQFYNYDYSNFNNHYFKDINGVLNKFIGNWKYQTATDLVKITIYKDEGHDNGSGYLSDELQLKFRYTNNGTVIYDTFIENSSRYILGLYFKFPNDTNKYHLFYEEPGQDRQGRFQYLDIEYIPNNTGGQPQLNWVIYTELSAAAGENPPIMPLNMVFTKQP